MPPSRVARALSVGTAASTTIEFGPRPTSSCSLRTDGPDPTTCAPGFAHSNPCRNGSGKTPTTTGTLKPEPPQER